MSGPAVTAGDRDIDCELSSLDHVDWGRHSEALLERGFAAIGPLLDPTTCQSVSRWFDEDAWYRSHIDMARHGFGRGEYKYFADPLPRLVTALRQTLYGRLEPVANTWLEMLGRNDWFPKDHKAFVDRCHEAGQCHPTPLLLRYGVGDYNCLHQDLYGDHVFPLQVAIMLSEPGTDFSGGEFILTEQRPRMQSRVEVIPLGLGEAVVFAVNERPVIGKRGVYRVRMRHGVSRVLSGQRHVLGIIFHDAA